jgi:hypothetical protein
MAAEVRARRLSCHHEGCRRRTRCERLKDGFARVRKSDRLEGASVPVLSASEAGGAGDTKRRTP